MPNEQYNKWLGAVAGASTPSSKDDQSSKKTTGGGKKDALSPEDFMIDLDQKQKVLGELRAALAPTRDKLKGAWKGIRANKSLSVLVEDGTSIDEADATEYDMETLSKTAGDKLDIIAACTNKIINLFEDFYKITSDVRPGEPLFTQAELMAELWTPLVRERLVPETLVPNKFSEVKKMMDETNALYQKKVAELKASGKLTPPTDRARLYGKAALKLAKAGVDVAGDATGLKALELTGQVLEVTEVVYNAGFEIKDEIKDAIEKKDPWKKVALKIVGTACTTLAEAAGSSLAQTVGDKLDDNDKKLYICIMQNTERALKGAAFGSKFAAAFLEDDKAKIGKAIGACVWQAVFDALGDAAGSAWGDKLGDKLQPFIDNAAGKPQTTTGDSDDADKFDGGDFCNTLAGFVGNALLKSCAECVRDKKKLNEFLKKQDAKAKEGDKKEQEEFEKEKERFKEILNGGQVGTSAAAASSIDRLIKEIKLQRKVIDTAVAIADGGIGLASKLFSPLAMAQTALALANNIRKASIHVSAFLDWKDNTKNFVNAQSALTSSSQNFVKNQGEQFTHYTLIVMAKAVELIGQVLQSAGLVATATGVGAVVGAGLTTAGKITESSGKAAEEVENVLYTVYKAEDLEAAWRATREAFSNPENRRLALVARKKNPSLAKYSIAWGAMVANDPVAKDAMRKCGLNNDSLRNKNTDVDKVVKYLETLYDEDNKIYREFKGFLSCLPDVPEISIEMWAKVSTGAKAKPGGEKGGCAGLLQKLPHEYVAVTNLIANYTVAVQTAKADSFISFKTRTLGLVAKAKTSPVPPVLFEESKSSLADIKLVTTDLKGALSEVVFKAVDDKDNKAYQQKKTVAQALNGLIKSLVEDCDGILKGCDELQTALENINKKDSKEKDTKEKDTKEKDTKEKDTKGKDTKEKPKSDDRNPIAMIMASISAADWDYTHARWEEIKKQNSLPDTKEANIGKFGKFLDAVGAAIANARKKANKPAVSDLKKALEQVKQQLDVYKNHKKTNPKIIKAGSMEVVQTMIDRADKIIKKLETITS